MKSTNNAVRCSLQLLQLSTPIGPVKVTGCDQGIHEIKLTPTDKAPCGKLRSVTIDGEERKQDLSGPLKECLGWLESFFKDASSIASLPLPPLHMTGIKSGSFMDKVLHSLDDIVPVGKTITYKNLAIEMKNPRAARAVGLAMARNPLPIVIPCHRVTSSDGDLNKYISDTFVSKVLHTLAHDIPAGETISYGRLAEKVGNPKACRAVGMAMRINQVPLVVPCHRVVNSDGSLGNYMSGKGVAIKKFLLDHEGAKVKT